MSVASLMYLDYFLCINPFHIHFDFVQLPHPLYQYVASDAMAGGEFSCSAWRSYDLLCLLSRPNASNAGVDLDVVAVA